MKSFRRTPRGSVQRAPWFRFETLEPRAMLSASPLDAESCDHTSPAADDLPAAEAQAASSSIVANAVGDGDLNDDLAVDAEDIDILADMIFRGGIDPGGDDPGDLDSSGGLGQGDMDYLIGVIIGTTYGDANLDSAVDFADDLQAWVTRDSQGGGISWATGDFDGDNDVDGADFDFLRLRPTALAGSGSLLTASDSDEPRAGASVTAEVSRVASDVTSEASPVSEMSTPLAQDHVAAPKVAAPRSAAGDGESSAASQTDDVPSSNVDLSIADSTMYRSQHLGRKLAPPSDIGQGLEQLLG